VLIADVVFGWPSEAWYWAPQWTPLLAWLPTRWLSFELMRRLQVGAGVVAFLLLSAWVFRLRRASSSPTTAALGWLLLGAIAALLPALGTLPMSRLTAAAAIGIAAAIGCSLVWLLARLRAPVSLTQRAAVVMLTVALLYLQAFRPARRSYEEGSFYGARGRAEQTWVLGAELDGDLSDKELFIISAHDWATACALPAVRHLHGLSMPASSQVLTPVPNSPHKLTRVARNILDVRIVRAPPVGTFSASVYRSERAAFRVGDVIRTPLLGAVVMEMRGRDPILVRFYFPMPLDDPHYVFLYPVDAGLRRLQLPEVGESVVLPAAAWPL
jgi:hypothetical protein